MSRLSLICSRISQQFMELEGFFFLSGVGQSPLGTAANSGLLYQSQMMMVIVKQLVELRLAGGTEVLGENLPQSHFVHHKPT
jgi:hypothetical protein